MEKFALFFVICSVGIVNVITDPIYDDEFEYHKAFEQGYNEFFGEDNKKNKHDFEDSNDSEDPFIKEDPDFRLTQNCDIINNTRNRLELMQYYDPDYYDRL